MKRFLVLTFLIAAVLLSGCGLSTSPSPRANIFNDYFKSSEQVIKKMNDKVALIEKKNATILDQQEKLKNLAEEKNIIQQAVDDIKKLKTPRELASYRDKNLQILDKGYSLLSVAEDGIRKNDMKDFNDKYQQNLVQETKLKHELDNIIDQAAKEAGLDVIRKDNKVLFN